MVNLPEIKQGKTYAVPHFPTVMQAVIFRLWDMVPCTRIAEVLETSPEIVLELAAQMGLKAQKNLEGWFEKGYISILRNVWQILPYEQILQLLRWDEERLSYVLKEDDFLNVKFGWFKFDCPKVVYKPLTEKQRLETEKVRKTMEKFIQPVKDTAVPFDFFHSNYKPLSGRRNCCVEITDDWSIVNYAGDAVCCYIEDFCSELKQNFGVSLTNGGNKKICIYSDRCSKDAEYHEIDIQESGIEIHTAGEEGVLRALYFLLQIAQDNGKCAFEKRKYKRTATIKTRYIYSFCGLYGDVLDVDNSVSFPDNLLRNYAMYGINGIWIQAVLYRIAPFPYEPALSEGWEERIANLKNLTERAARFGIKVYLYLNEPRGMPWSFFEKYPHLKGRTYFDGLACLCTSNFEIQEYLRNALTSVCKAVPDLGGFFNISMSENLTHCYSREMQPGDEMCPVCKNRAPEDVTAEVISVMADAVKAANPNMRFFALTWAWERVFTLEQIGRLIQKLPKHVVVMNVSENQLAFEKGGVKGEVIDYTLSMPGPSAWSETVWKMAREQELEIGAKVQINNSWECSTAPFLPVYETVLTHMKNLKEQHVAHIMLSWTLGGYPSDNIKIATSTFFEDAYTQTDSYQEVLKSSYGEYAEKVAAAVKHFCAAFSEFPFSLQTLYYGPQNLGAANLLFKEPTGLAATMTCYPYDDLETWLGNYPPDVFELQFEKLCTEWKKGLDLLSGMPDCAFYDMALYGYTLFKSSHNQIRFCRNRQNAEKAEMVEGIIKEEMELAKLAYEIMARNSAVGYEAANHYYVTKTMLAEKIISCAFMLDEFNNI